MNVSCYLNKEEMEFFSGYPKGWLKQLVLREMTAPKGAESAAQVDEEVDALTREHFPPDDPRFLVGEPDVFGPRLKR